MDILSMTNEQLAKRINWGVVEPMKVDWWRYFAENPCDAYALEMWDYSKVKKLLILIDNDKLSPVVESIKEAYNNWLFQFVAKEHSLYMPAFPPLEDMPPVPNLPVVYDYVCKYYNGWCKGLDEHISDLLNPDNEPSQENTALPPELDTDRARCDIGNAECQFHLPPEFDTPEARQLFDTMIECGFMSVDGGVYKWIATASLFGYFVDVTSKFLKIRSSNGNKPWRKYRPIITNYERVVATAKQAVNDYENKDLSKPEGYEKILNACE